jgi:23S rRNA (adenine2503-C2)-methyltransferase
VSIEYALIDGVNDQPGRADLLARLLRDRPAHVNLIPLNPTRGSSWHASAPANQRDFVERLRARGVTTTVRDTRGREIAAACGQLAADDTGRARRAARGAGAPGASVHDVALGAAGDDAPSATAADSDGAGHGRP